MIRRTYVSSQAFALHASAVEYQGKAVLFLGPSGAGKSTLAKLIGDQFPILADDQVYVPLNTMEARTVTDATNDKPPRSLSLEQIRKMTWTEIGAACLIHQAQRCYLEDMAPINTCFHLVQSFMGVRFYVKSDVSFKHKVFSAIASIARQIQGYHLFFSRNTEIVDLLTDDFMEGIL